MNQPASILVVDDNAANRETLHELLAAENYRLIDAADGPTALRLAGEAPPDLVLLDVMMPGMDGFEVCRRLRADPRLAEVPVIMVTALDDQASRLAGLEAGADDFVTKPFNRAELRARVRTTTRLNRYRRLHEAQAALRDSEKHFRALFELGGIAIYTCDAAGTIQEFNRNAVKLWGREPNPAAEEERFSGPFKMCRPDGAALPLEQSAIAGVCSGKIPGVENQEFLVERPDGVRLTILVNIVPLRNERGEITCAINSVLDITERKRVEEELRLSEERHRRIIMSSPDAQFVHANGLITLVNQAFCRLMGATEPAQLLGRPALEVAHPDYHALVLERRRKHFDNQPLPPAEMKFVRLDGTTVDVELNATAFESRGRKEVQVVARDITIRNQMVTALRESEERFKFVARAISDVVWDWNLTARTLWWNDGFLTTFGFAAGEIVPSVEAWTNRIHPDERQGVIESIDRAVGSGSETWTADYRVQRKDGTYAFVQDRGYILRNAAGQGIRMVGGLRDLTEQRRMETQNLRTQRLESIGTLAGGIAHDLNNVLAPILLSIELLKADAGNDPRRNKILDIIYVSSRRGADLVRQVMSFALGQDGQRIAIRLPRLIDDLVAISSETFPRQIRIVAEVAKYLWPVKGDPTQLHQVLLNLAVNARDAMPQGGTLTITADNVTIDAQYAATSAKAQAGPYVLLRVTDTGQGIPPAVRERIFDPFFTTKELGKGTGLGLATVHTVVKSHGGFLTVDSEVGRGTTFKIYLPAEPALQTAEPGLRPRAELPRGRDELVLVVDDEPAIRDITKRTLETFGYRVITASDGTEAVALYARQAEQIALVITDMMMPVMDGFATIQVLLRLNPAIRIIVASGSDSGKNAARVKRVGVQDFLPKPFEAEVLLQLIREVLDRPAAGPKSL